MPARAPEGCRGCSPGPEARTWGEALSARGSGGTGQRERCPQSWCQVGPGAPGWAPLGAGNFCLRDPLFLAAGAGWLGCAGAREALLFSGNWKKPRCPAQAARGWGTRGRKSSYDSGDGDSVARGARLLLTATWVCKNISPGSHGQKRGGSEGLTSARFARCFLSRE